MKHLNNPLGHKDDYYNPYISEFFMTHKVVINTVKDSKNGKNNMAQPK